MIFQTPNLDDREQDVVERIKELRQALRRQVAEPLTWVGLLRRVTFARAIRGSNSIEGINVSLDDAVAAAGDQEPLDAEDEVWAAISGYRNAMTYVLQLADDPHFTFDCSLLRSLHYMMMRHDLNKSPGRWRPGEIFVRDEGTDEIVYEGPDFLEVPALMNELVGELAGDDDHPVSVRAAMAHLNLAMIHPFRDGNGRMARCLQTLVLAREGVVAPVFSSIEEYLGRNTGSYYAVLAEVGGGRWQPRRDARPWIRFVLMAHYRQATTLLRRSAEAQARWDSLAATAEKMGFPDRATFALYHAALGFRLRSSIYRQHADVSNAIANRDLRALSEAGLLIPHGENRGRFYSASEELRAIELSIRRDRTPVGDPFEDSPRQPMPAI